MSVGYILFEMRSTYPSQEDIAEILHFIARFNPRVSGGLCTATDKETGSEFTAYIGAEKLFEVEANLARRKRNILEKPYKITSYEHFVWVLFCKLRQKREI